MNQLKYLSPTSLGLWEADREQFYMKYLAEGTERQENQSPAASVGSAFDAYVKSSLYKDVIAGDDPKYSFDYLFETQVETQNRDFAKTAGQHALSCYTYSGNYDGLRKDLMDSVYQPQFEFKLEGTIEGVPLIGKPDLRYIHAKGVDIVADWKVNGYCSAHATSPAKLYARVRDGQELLKPSKNDGNSHPGYVPLDFKGLEIGTHYLEEVNKDWGTQLTIYSWLLGEPIGSEEFVVRIDQLVCKPGTPPTIRVANQFARISADFQRTLLVRLQDCWRVINSGHIFQELTLEESIERCELLDQMATIEGTALQELRDQSKRTWKG